VVTDTQGKVCSVQFPCGSHFNGINVNAAAKGSKAQACIRPERIHAQFATDRPSANCLQAKVDDVIYFGDHLRLRCKVANQLEATVKIALSSQTVPAPGDQVWLHLPPEHLRIYL
jgi:putative spermidine/putrescine transport system ATP-binding protein